MIDQATPSTYVEPPTRFAAGTEVKLYYRGTDKKLHALGVETGTVGLRYHSGLESLLYFGVKMAKEDTSARFKPPMLILFINPHPVVPFLNTPKERA